MSSPTPAEHFTAQAAKWQAKAEQSAHNPNGVEHRQAKFWAETYAKYAAVAAQERTQNNT